MDKNIFADEIRKSESTLYRVSRSILQNNKDCEDAVQEAIMKAYHKLYTLRREEYFKTWLVRILIHECYKIKRYQNRLVSYEEYITTKKINMSEEYSELYLTIMDLDEDLRVPVMLYYIEGFSVAETADILKIRQGTLKSRLSRARTNLKKWLGEV